MLGGDAFTVTPRRGELIVFDSSRARSSTTSCWRCRRRCRRACSSPPRYSATSWSAPPPRTSSARTTPPPPLRVDHLRREAGRIVRRLLDFDVTAVYVGLRAAPSTPTSRSVEDGYACVGGIRSTRLSASMAIAEHVRDWLELELRARGRRRRSGCRTWARPRRGAFQRGELIEREPDYGRVVCFCERVTREELRDALASPIPPVDLDGLGQRTRAHMGPSQGCWSGARLAAFLGEGRRCLTASHGHRRWAGRAGGGGGVAPARRTEVVVPSRRRRPAGSRATRSTRASAARHAAGAERAGVARRWVELAREAGVELLEETMVAGSGQGGWPPEPRG